MADLISFDTSLLAGYYNARINLRGASLAATGKVSPQLDSEEVETPWDVGRKDNGIAGRLAELRGRDSLFDFDAENVKAAGDDETTRNLFAMYEAVRRLRIIAEYAADDKTVPAVLSSLDEQFQAGLGEIGDFLKTTTFDDATILMGEKSNHLTSQATAYRVDYDYVGRTVVIGAKDTPLTNLNGDETFTITLSKGDNTDTFTVDLSQISGDITLEKITQLANDQIAAVTDVNEDGETVQRYRSRLTIEDLSETRHALKVRGFAGEDVSFSAAAGDPTLTIAGTVQHTGTSSLSEGYIYTLGDLSGSDPTQISRTQITSTVPGAAVLAEQEAEEHEDDENYVPSDVEKANTTARATATDAEGNTYVVGNAQGDMGDQFAQGANDVYVSKYDSAGNFLWARLLGSSSDASAYSIATDSKGNVVIAGQTQENLTPGAVIESKDSFVTKYSSTGEELFTRQVQAAAEDGALDLTVDANGDIYVSGYVKGQIDANATAQGDKDAYIQKIGGSSGAIVYSHQFGTAGTDEATSIAIAGDGNILALSEENGHAVLRKLDATDPSNEMFSVDLGALGAGGLTDLAVDGSAVYITGFTDNASFGGGSTATAHHGGSDGFLMRIDDNGASASTAYTSFIGGTGSDRAYSLATDNGNVYVVGSTGDGLNGQTPTYARDAYAVKVDASTGAQVWTKLFGGGQGLSDATSVSVNAQGGSVLSKLGLPSGEVAANQSRNVVSQTSVRAGDYFYVSVNGGSKHKITIDEDDTFQTLAAKVNRLSFLYIDASSYYTKSGDALDIKALHGAQIDIIPGDGEHDALKGLGLDATKIVASDEELNESDDTDSTDDTESTDSDSESESDEPTDNVWGLNLASGLRLDNKKAAQYALARIDDALSEIRSIYRALNPDPLVEALKNQKSSGTAPAYLQAQLANYQAGLDRLTAGTDEASILF